MNLWKSLAILGIWLGLGLMSTHIDGGPMMIIALFAMFATISITEG